MNSQNLTLRPAMSVVNNGTMFSWNKKNIKKINIQSVQICLYFKADINLKTKITDPKELFMYLMQIHNMYACMKK